MTLTNLLLIAICKRQMHEHLNLNPSFVGRKRARRQRQRRRNLKLGSSDFAAIKHVQKCSMMIMHDWQ